MDSHPSTEYSNPPEPRRGASEACMDHNNLPPPLPPHQ